MPFRIDECSARFHADAADRLQKISGVHAGVQRAAVKIECAITARVSYLRGEQIATVQIERAAGSRKSRHQNNAQHIRSAIQIPDSDRTFGYPSLRNRVSQGTASLIDHARAW